MSKRRERKQNNLPEATLQRAREQAGLSEEPAETKEAAVEAAAPTSTAASAKPKNTPATSGRQRRSITTAQLERSKKRGDLDHETIEYLLEHPTKVVSEGELREAYSHVIADLRNMALLAVALVAVMIVVALVIF